MVGVADRLKSTVVDLPVRVGKLLEREKELQKKLEKAISGAGGGLAGVEAQVSGAKLFFGFLAEADAAALKPLADKKLAELGPLGFVVLAASVDGEDGPKASLLALAGKDAARTLSAGAFVKAATGAFGGRGGGKADFAQGGGGDLGRFSAWAGGGIGALKAWAEAGGQ